MAPKNMRNGQVEMAIVQQVQHCEKDRFHIILESLVEVRTILRKEGFEAVKEVMRL